MTRHMTRGELVSRAYERARGMHTRAGEVGIYYVHSQTSATWYRLRVLYDGRVIHEPNEAYPATCSGFEYRQSCDHICAVTKRAYREGLAVNIWDPGYHPFHAPRIGAGA